LHFPFGINKAPSEAELVVATARELRRFSLLRFLRSDERAGNPLCKTSAAAIVLSWKRRAIFYILDGRIDWDACSHSNQHGEEKCHHPTTRCPDCDAHVAFRFFLTVS
jgi:hypothetical protein